MVVVSKFNNNSGGGGGVDAAQRSVSPLDRKMIVRFFTTWRFIFHGPEKFLVCKFFVSCSFTRLSGTPWYLRCGCKYDCGKLDG